MSAGRLPLLLGEGTDLMGASAETVTLRRQLDRAVSDEVRHYHSGFQSHRTKGNLCSGLGWLPPRAPTTGIDTEDSQHHMP